MILKIVVTNNFLTNNNFTMKQLFIILMTILPLLLCAQVQCKGTTKKGEQCSRTVKQGQYCWQHNPEKQAETASFGTKVTDAHVCGAPTKSGGRCKNRVVKSAYCHLHKSFK